MQSRRGFVSRLVRGLLQMAGPLLLAGPLLIVLSPIEAQAQKLTIQGDRFAVDGEPRFLTFMTMFGAMAAPDIAADMQTVRALGFDGVRIWPNLDTGPQLMNGDGTLKPDELERLRLILDEARKQRILVDVSFTFEHIRGLDAARARVGIAAATEALRSYDNFLIDIQNERNVTDRRFMSETDVARALAAIKSVDPARIVVASNSPVDPPEYAADFTARVGLDATAYHEPRNSRWYTASEVQSVVGAMRKNGKPAYLQEPMSTRDDLFPYPAHDRADYFMQAIANAKLAGAAAWCFHTDVAVDYRTGPRLLEDRLRQYAEPEWAFVNSLTPRVLLRANNAVNFVVAEGGGGAAVRADRTAFGPGGWLVLGLSVLSGGPPISGDRVAFATVDGKHFLQAVGGGGASLRASSQSVGGWETFVIERVGGGVIRHGDSVTLRTADAPWYVTAESGGGGNVFVNSASRGGWETFTVFFATPHLSATP
jgi:hypothetical protein